MPVAAQALAAGRIGVEQAEALAKARANPRCGDLLVESAELLVEWCEQLSFDEARICIKRWEALADEDGAHRNRAADEENRRAFVGATDGAVDC